MSRSHVFVAAVALSMLPAATTAQAVRRAITTGGGVCQILDLSGGAPVLMQQHNAVGSGSEDIVITPNGRVAAVRTASTLQFYDMLTAGQLATFAMGGAAGSDWVAATDRRVVALGGGQVRIYDVTVSPPALLLAHAAVGGGEDLEITPDGRMAVVRTGNTVQFFELEGATHVLQTPMPGPGLGADWVAVTNERAVVLGSGVVHVFDLTASPVPVRILAHNSVGVGLEDLEITPDGTTAVVSTVSTVQFFDIITPAHLLTSAHPAAPSGSDWIATTNRRAVSLGNNTAKLFSLDSAMPALLQQFATGPGGDSDVAISADGNRLATANGNVVQFRTLHTGSVLNAFGLPSPGGGADWLELTARRAIVVGGNIAHVYDLTGLNVVLIGTVTSPGSGGNDLAISRDGTIAALRSGGTTKFIDLETAAVLGTFATGVGGGSDWIEMANVTVDSPAGSCTALDRMVPGLDLQLGDDQTVVMALPFSFPFDGGTFTEVGVCSNGFVWLGNQTSAPYWDNEAAFLSQPPRVAACWDDWNPSLGGAVYFDATASQASIVWRDVPRYGAAHVRADMEIVLSATGEIDIRWGDGMSTTASSSIVGISAGFGAAANSLDWGALPNVANATGYQLFAGGEFDLAAGALALVPGATTNYASLDVGLASCPPGTSGGLATAVPYGISCPGPTPPLSHLPLTVPSLGTTYRLQVANIPAGTPFGVIVLGLSQVTVDLSPLGMTGCFQHASADALESLLIAGSSSVLFNFAVPADPNLAGVQLHSQAATLSVGFNPFGLVTSNGVRGTLGN